MKEKDTVLIDHWPKYTFKELEDLQIEGRFTRLFYKSFFYFLRLPEIIFSSFLIVLYHSLKKEYK